MKRASSTEAVETESFLAEHVDGGPFEVRFVGDRLLATFSKRRCAYFEWQYGRGQDGAGHSRGYQSENAVAVIATLSGTARVPRGAQSFELSSRKLRPYVEPSFSRQACLGESWMPDSVADEVRAGATDLWVVERCLSLETTYHALVRAESFLLPPRGPNREPSRRTNRVLLVSDKPFVDRQPQGEVSPGFRRWSY